MRLNRGTHAFFLVVSIWFGAMDSGNAILSRWPIGDARRIPLALRSDQNALTRYFYLKRNILNARVDIPGQAGFHVVNVHTAAYSKDGTKRKHIDRFKAELDTLNRLNALFVGGGDLNAIPPGSIQVDGFDDSVCRDEDFVADDFAGELTWLAPLYGSYQPAIPLNAYQLDNAPYYTHTVDKDGFWNRKLDYLFTNGEWQVGSGLVHHVDYYPIKEVDNGYRNSVVDDWEFNLTAGWRFLF